MRASEFIQLLAPVVGRDRALVIAQRVAARWGGGSEAVFCDRAVERVRRNIEIAEDVAAGADVDDVAVRHGLSRRQVLRVADAVDTDAARK